MADALDYAVGDYICMAREPRIFGVAMYLGFPAFASGLWVGIELTEPIGRNDGCARGKRYFKCEPGRGLFVKANLCQKITYGAFVEATEAKIHKIIEDQSKRQQQSSPIRLGSPSGSPTSKSIQHLFSSIPSNPSVFHNSNNIHSNNNTNKIDNDFHINSAIYFSPSSSPEYKSRPGSSLQSPSNLQNNFTSSIGIISSNSRSVSPEASHLSPSQHRQQQQFNNILSSQSITPVSSRPSPQSRKKKEKDSSVGEDSALNQHNEISNLRNRTEHLERCIGRAGDLLSEMAEFAGSLTSLLDVALQNSSQISSSSSNDSQTVTVDLNMLLEVQNSLNALKELAESSHTDLAAVTAQKPSSNNSNNNNASNSTSNQETPTPGSKPRSGGFPRAVSPGSGPKKPSQNRKFLF